MDSRELPDVYYEQYVLGELDEEKRRLVEASPAFERRIAEIEESNHAILNAYPAEQFAKRIRNAYDAQAESKEAVGSKASQRRRSFRGIQLAGMRGSVLSYGLSAALVAVVAVSALLVFRPGVGQSDDIRLKGLEPELSVYHDGGSEIELLASGAEVSQGDSLQLSYNAAGGRHGWIFSIDGRGAFTLHYPSDFEAPDSLEPSGDVLLPYAYRLDDAPRFEKFYFVTSLEPIAPRNVMDAVNNQIEQQIADPNYEIQFDEDLSVASVLLRKTEI